MCTSAPGGADVFFYKYNGYTLWRGCERMHADATPLCPFVIILRPTLLGGWFVLKPTIKSPTATV